MAKQKPNPKPKRTPHAPKSKKAHIRSKNSPKKTPRAKRVAVTKQSHARRDETPRRKAKRTTTRTLPANSKRIKRKVRASDRGSGFRTVIKSQKLSQDQKSRIVKRRAQNRQFSEPVSKTTRGTGYRTQHLVKKSKTNGFNKQTLVKISSSTLSKKNHVKLSQKTSKAKEVTELLAKKGAQKLKALGKSDDNIRLVKLQYTYTHKGKKRKAYFSKGIARVSSAAEMKKQIEKTILEFEKRLSNYTDQGFSNISISGLRVHAYEE